MLPVAVIFAQGLFEVAGLTSFLVGYFASLQWLLLAGGFLVVLDDLIEIRMGVLSPVFPVFLALVLAFVFSPWYVGVFWASAAFKLLGLPTSLYKLFAPRRFAERAMGLAAD